MSTDKSQSLEIVTPQLSSTLFSDEQLELLVQASASTGIKSKGEALLVFQKARELGIGAGNAIAHIHVVNGKSGIDIHIIKALLSRPSSGVEWEQVQDFEPIYEYTDGKSIFRGDELPNDAIIVNSINGNKNAQELIAKGELVITKKPTMKGVVKHYLPVDWISSYDITRTKRNIKGEWTTKTIHTSFKWSEALKAGLPLDRDNQINPNSNWAKYTKLMLGIRAFTFGARDIASDILLGTYESTELYDMNNINYNIDEEGKTTIID